MQMYLDRLPIWGFIGKDEKIEIAPNSHASKYYLFTHIHFDIRFNANQIISVETLADPDTVLDITDGGARDVTFTYSVKWAETEEKVLSPSLPHTRCCSLVHGWGQVVSLLRHAPTLLPSSLRPANAPCVRWTAEHLP